MPETCDYTEDQDVYDAEDEYETAMEACGYYPAERVCLHAGSEYCDFECPLRRELEAE